MMRSARKYSILFIAVVLVAGCHGPYSPIAPAGGAAPIQTREGVTMLSRGVRDSLLLRNQTATRTPAGQIRVQVIMQNRFEKDDLWCEVQFLFFNDKGVPVEKSEWQNVSFPAREPVTVDGNSLRTDVKSFNIQFRHLKSSTGRLVEASGTVFEKGIWFSSILPK